MPVFVQWSGLLVAGWLLALLLRRLLPGAVARVIGIGISWMLTALAVAFAAWSLSGLGSVRGVTDAFFFLILVYVGVALMIFLYGHFLRRVLAG